MNRPLALIEGNLAIPLPRPFDGLPPPFGARRRLMREAMHRTVNGATKPSRASLFPPGVKHVLFYKAPPKRVDAGRWDDVMAEAKRYLEMDTRRPRSSRSDHMLAASIFAGCSIALTWLLVTCSMHEATKLKSVTPTLVAAAKPRVDRAQPEAGPAAVADTQAKLATSGPATSTSLVVAIKKHVAAAGPASVEAPPKAAASRAVQVDLLLSPLAKSTTQLISRQTVQRTVRAHDTVAQPSRPAKRVSVARLTQAHANERVALNRVIHPATRPAVSTQPEWAASPSHTASASDDTPWLNWAAQQHRPAPTLRSATPVDNTWNDRMTQRRITDDPAAFHVDRSGK
jgi:hypothetical protein